MTAAVEDDGLADVLEPLALHADTRPTPGDEPRPARLAGVAAPRVRAPL